jgi:CelD/BcsL family acetyltransferase involved in cellulose biosynthesis
VTSPSAPWREDLARLHCLLGEWHVHTFELPVLSRAVRPMRGDLPVELESLPLPSLPVHLAGYRLPSIPVSGVLPRLSRQGALIRYVTAQYRRFFVDLRRTHAEWMESFSAKTRSTFRRKVKRFGEHFGGRVELRAFVTPGQIREFFPLARAVSASTYQERLLRQGLPDAPAYLEELVTRAAHDGVRGYLLVGGGETLAYLCCHVEDGVVEYTHVGYDPAFAALSPGTVLLLGALEMLFAERRFAAFDFTEGEGPHKELFADSAVACADVLLLPANRVGALGAGLAHYATASVSRAAVSLVETLGIKRRLKRLLRRGGASVPHEASAPVHLPAESSP